MKRIFITFLGVLFVASQMRATSYLQNEYAYLQTVTFEMYTEDLPDYKVPEEMKSIEETLMFQILHATWIDKHWVSYTLNKDLLGTFKVGQPAISDNGDTKKMFFIATFPGGAGGLDLYTSEYKNGTWSKPKNLGSTVNTAKNESNPGFLNDHTLTYSSGGIIKKLDLKTLKVVDIEAPVAQNDKAIDPVVVQNNNADIKENKNVPTPETVKVEVQNTSVVQSNGNISSDNSSATSAEMIQSLGVQSREAMLAKYKTAIQLGAFSSPKWEQIYPLAKFGKLITYKNEKGVNVVWLTGFANRTTAENTIAEVKSITGFENAYITGK